MTLRIFFVGLVAFSYNDGTNPTAMKVDLPSEPTHFPFLLYDEDQWTLPATRCNYVLHLIDLMNRRFGIAALLTVALTSVSSRQALTESPNSNALVVYASQSGMPTLDQGVGGGNPFASALIELLQRPSLTLRELRSDLIELAKEKSRAFQVPDFPIIPEATQWRLKPVPASPNRLALVFVFSDYRNAGRSSLPGARYDLDRVASSLKEAGFAVQAAANPTRGELKVLLTELSRRSETAEAALIYTTGHGYEHEGVVYLLPGDYPFDAGSNRLPDLSVDVAALARHLKAKSANLVFFGGCRTHW